MDSAETAPLTVEDELLAELRNTNAVVAALVESLARGSGQVQNQNVRNDLGGFVAGASLAACIATVLLMVGFIVLENRSYGELSRKTDRAMAEMRDDMRDQKAWTEVLRGKVSKLEGQAK